MHIRKWGGAALVLLIGVGLATAQPPKSKAMPEGWFGDLMGWSKPKPKPIEDAKAPAGGAATPAAPPDRVLAHERIMNAFLRRQAVCQRLLDIADETQDKKLEREARELDDMAYNLYNDQVRALGIPVRTTLPVENEPEAEAEADSPSMPRLPRTGQLPARFRSGGLSAGIREGDR